MLCEVKEAVPVPIPGVISDGQQTIRQAAHVLANHENEKGQAVRERYKRVLDTMREQ